jgi:hypothetical protein
VRVADVARRQGAHRNQLHLWRRRARQLSTMPGKLRFVAVAGCVSRDACSAGLGEMILRTVAHTKRLGSEALVGAPSRSRLRQASSLTCRWQTRFTIIYRDLQRLISSRSPGPLFFPMRREAVARVHERSESRLAEMDPGGENHRRVYRIRDKQPALSAAGSGPPVISANFSRVTDRRVVCGGRQHEYRYRTGSEPC